MISYDRIMSILSPESFKDIDILAIGVGSGNSNVIAELAKNGFQNFYMWDHDVLEPENLVRHVLGGKSLGKPKVEEMSHWLTDRNPKISAYPFQQKFQQSNEFIEILNNDRKKYVLIGVDDHLQRLHLNDLCVTAQVPYTLGMVFREGIGGMSFNFLPNKTGCFNCLNDFSNKNGLSLSLADKKETNHTEEEIYSLGLQRYEKSPGLSIDIGIVSLIMSKMAITGIHDFYKVSSHLPKMKFNFLTITNYPNSILPGTFFEPQNYINILPQKTCSLCTNG